ncbi:methyltransferase type 11 [Halobellus salinus]|uniref:Methyltransferase type 11 n=1 Tax=Halobellus salinus TaxID=931585 RepID=A0A830EDI1_9EURY|nr:class I SAM-dependent methyltransferase [Halobellus salinus]GGI94540.1 methyltransferase type 11 [Halobellus salinus]SMP20065.1 Methyltransferase domain-containing protein [Halobellus salinus]
MEHALPRYLESKRSVDERALSMRVRDRFLDALPPAPTILETGCGTGVTVPRLVSWGVDGGRYVGVDADDRIVAFARRVRPKSLNRAGYTVSEGSPPAGDGTGRSTDPDPEFTVEGLAVGFETGDALEALSAAEGVDAVIAQAFADLVSPSELVSAVESALRPGGVAYLPITFDGGTIVQPDHPADDAVEAAYHAAIDGRPGRDVRAGRHLIDLCRSRDGDLLAVGSSDWIVRPRGGEYPADERYFLDRLLGFVEGTVPAGDRTVEAFDDWLSTRRDQLARGELTYVAHQYDLLYRTPTG